MRQIFTPPVFADPDLTRRAAVFYQMVFAEFAIVCVIAFIAAFTEPASRLWFFSVVAVDILFAVSTLALCRRGWVDPASWILVAINVIMTIARAPWIGGIHSPALMLLGSHTLMAGILLGKRNGYLVGTVCAGLCLGLLAAEEFGMLPAQAVFYGPGTYFFLLMLNMGFVFFLLDISSRSLQAAFRRANSELTQRRQAEQHLGIALDAGQIGIWEGDLKAQQFLTVDERTSLITGLPRGQDGAVSFDALMNAILFQDRPSFAALIGALNKGLQRAKSEFRILRPDGEIRHLEVTAAPLNDHGRQSVLHIGTVINVTDKKTAVDEREQLVRVLQERVKELRVLHLAGVLLHNRPYEPKVLDELVALLPQGWTYPESCEARITYRDHVATTPGWRETAWRQSARFETSGGTGTVEVVYLHEWQVSNEGPFSAEERLLLTSIVEMLVTYIEIDLRAKEQKLLEQRLRESQKMEAMGKLAGGITHDFNNLLSAILGFANLLHDDLPEGSEQRRFAGRIRAASHRGAELVGQIFSFASSGNQQRERIGLIAFLNENESLVAKMLAENTGIAFSRPDREIHVSANSAQLSQLITNICKNAGESYGDQPGIVKIAVSVPSECEIASIAERRHTDHSLLIGVPVPLQAYGCIRISDNGSGISPDLLNKIFDPFFSTKGKKGSGLGLSIVERIIASQDGFCLIETGVGRGTTFSVYLPKDEIRDEIGGIAEPKVTYAT